MLGVGAQVSQRSAAGARHGVGARSRRRGREGGLAEEASRREGGSPGSECLSKSQHSKSRRSICSVSGTLTPFRRRERKRKETGVEGEEI